MATKLSPEFQDQWEYKNYGMKREHKHVLQVYIDNWRSRKGIYVQVKHKTGKKLHPKSEISRLVCMESNSRIIRPEIPESGEVRVVRSAE